VDESRLPRRRWPSAASHFDNDPFDFTAGINIMAANHPREKYWVKFQHGLKPGRRRERTQPWPSMLGGFSDVTLKSLSSRPLNAQPPGSRAIFTRITSTQTRHRLTILQPFHRVVASLAGHESHWVWRIGGNANGSIEYEKELSPGGQGALLATPSVVDTYGLMPHGGGRMTLQLR